MGVEGRLGLKMAGKLLACRVPGGTYARAATPDRSVNAVDAINCLDRIVFASRMPAAQVNSPYIYAAEKHAVPRPGSGICGCVFPRHRRHGAARAHAAQ